uniref:Glutathione transferase n=1 Tax=Steinernema glaseri TaxID=37863 RepID=A0A1I8AIF4_9BILA
MVVNKRGALDVYDTHFVMPTYKLYYFVGRGRGEHCRHLFKLAGVEFEDIRYDGVTWPPHKDEMPLKQIPVLEVDGVKIGQSLAISRFLGHEFGFAGKNRLENAQLDMLADVIMDIYNAPGINEWPYVLLGMKEGNKDEYFRDVVLPALDKQAPLVESFIEKNGHHLLFGDKVTWVDVVAAEFFSRFIDFGAQDGLKKYPNIEGLVKKVHSLPAIKEHIAQRKPCVA